MSTSFFVDNLKISKSSLFFNSTPSTSPKHVWNGRFMNTNPRNRYFCILCSASLYQWGRLPQSRQASLYGFPLRCRFSVLACTKAGRVCQSGRSLQALRSESKATSQFMHPWKRLVGGGSQHRPHRRSLSHQIMLPDWILLPHPRSYPGSFTNLCFFFIPCRNVS